MNTIEIVYRSPEVFVMEIAPEGIFCQSGSFEQWGEENLDWNV